MQENIFSKYTTVLTIIISLLGIIGAYNISTYRTLIVVITSLLIVGLLIAEKIGQIDENTENIEKLKERLDIERRINIVEKELYEQKGKISLLVRPHEKNNP